MYNASCLMSTALSKWLYMTIATADKRHGAIDGMREKTQTVAAPVSEHSWLSNMRNGIVLKLQ